MKIFSQKAYYYMFLTQSINKNSNSLYSETELISALADVFRLNKGETASVEKAFQDVALKCAKSSYLVDLLIQWDNEFPDSAVCSAPEEVYQIKKRALTFLENFISPSSSDDALAQVSIKKAENPVLCFAHAIFECLEGVSNKTLASLKKFAIQDKNVDCLILLLSLDEKNYDQYFSLLAEHPTFLLRKKELSRFKLNKEK